MKPVSVCWAMSVMIAVCVTPGVGSFMRRTAAISHPMMLVQEDGTVAVPGSAEAPGSTAGSDDDDQSGQVGNNCQGSDGQGPDGQTPDDDSAQPPTSMQQQTPDDDSAADQQEPPTNVQQPPSDDDGDDTAAQQKSDDNSDQGEGDTHAPASGDDQN
jgi:hypothetical protein